MPPPPQLLQPPRWTSDELERDRQRAIEIFRKQRLEEPLEVYLEAFDEKQKAFEDLLELTVDLTQIRERAVDILADKRLRDALRYIAGPPISDDDWKTLADATFARRKLQEDPALADRLIQKVSNSYTNSIKRLNNDAAVKAEVWRHDFGDMNVIPAAVLSGVYKLHNLEDAQRRGLTLLWAHSLEAQLLDWIDMTRT
jgi:hypothetical protein